MPNRVSNRQSFLLNLQISQVRELSSLRPPREDKLRFFRRTLKMKEFSQLINVGYPAPVYANQQDIETLEGELKAGNYMNLIVQCFSICEQYRRIRPRHRSYLGPSTLFAWMTTHHQPSIEVVSVLRYRLGFIQIPSRSHESVALLTCHVVREIIGERQLGWHEVLMLFRTTDSVETCIWVKNIDGNFDTGARGTPKAALSLLFSIILDCVTRAGLRGWLPTTEMMCKRLIMGLVSCGAFLMTSTNDHPALYQQIEKHLRLEQTPWWLQPEEPPKLPGNTALFRIAQMAWDDAELKMLMPSSCCRLNLGQDSARFFTECPTLQYLAAEKLRLSGVEELPPTMRHAVLKHITLPEPRQ